MIKLPFVVEIPGKIHECNEDSHYARVFKDISGTEWSFSLTADGLSGYGGLEASHLAVNVIRIRIEDTLSSTGCDDVSELIKSAILEANHRLDKPERPIHSTLDLILMRENELYLAHMGDGRIYFGCGLELVQVTTDEERGGIPINYLGGKRIHHDPYHLPIEERAHIIKVSLDSPEYYNALFTTGFIVPEKKSDETKIKAALSTPPHTLASMTDGFRRVPPAKLREILSERGEYHDRRDSITKLCQMDEYLPENLSAYEKQRLQIKFLYGLKDFTLREDLPKERIIEEMCAAYRSRKSPELVKRIDGFIRNDDATGVFWDLLDETGKSLEEFKELKEITLLDLQKKYTSTQSLLKTKEDNLSTAQAQLALREGEYNDLQVQSEGLRISNNSLVMARQEQDESISSLRLEKEGLDRDNKYLQERVAELERKEVKVSSEEVENIRVIPPPTRYVEDDIMTSLFNKVKKITKRRPK